jgi:hypothetical protein
MDLSGLACQTLQNIVLLSIFDKVVQPEEENPLPSRHDGKLSIWQELWLAQKLAFLAAYTNDPYKVMAVCLEASETGALIVQVVSNIGDLDHVVGGLLKIFKVLELVS